MSSILVICEEHYPLEFPVPLGTDLAKHTQIKQKRKQSVIIHLIIYSDKRLQLKNQTNMEKKI